MTDVALQEISMMIPEGNILKLPTNFQLTQYAKVKKLLLKAGGVYKRNTFVFKSDAAAIQNSFCAGEDMNKVKKFQYFPTPPQLVKKALEKADVQPHHSWLEPSAGQGHIADELMKISTNGCLVELMDDNVDVLREKHYDVQHIDFLEFNGGLYDRIVANPPFTNNQDIKHIQKMYEHLANDGVLVSYSSLSWKIGSQRIQNDFKNWLEAVGAEIELIEAGEFRSSGTEVSTVLITIRK